MLHAFYKYRNGIANDHNFNKPLNDNKQSRARERKREKKKENTSKFCLFLKKQFFLQVLHEDGNKCEWTLKTEC